MKRKIIKIDENKCNGCGACIPNCPEGALQIIDGKARLVGDLLCDGLGACLGNCPLGAISVEEREAEPYDEEKVMELVSTQGSSTITAHLSHLADHNQMEFLETALHWLRQKGMKEGEAWMENKKRKPAHSGCAGGCPGSAARDLSARTTAAAEVATRQEKSESSMASALENWPVQLKLINPAAPYLRDADLLICADCVPFAFKDFHKRILAGRKALVFCPKLDENLQEYVEKLAAIFRNQNIQSITLARMEVPCCGGVENIVRKALEASGKNIFVKVYTLSIEGEII
ncbi:MAG: 4Fe-4S ferredoxin [Candidatus Wallbacteria bacterium HGW-Wallbacteria-1]|jgi:NAD-dependent dihydropyrimidine dehydrogenase PreA subunit|uniref:4Fe-4S ferredoxin n=1 Tax=Candidatus Wallbacteria bacterium HGW-Wallbacteria-1 TaxID=2013854 RepID=A0A2N1PRR6_9BACT|nr:MAG: 4Fe-4S ferredoxin [Candidatus Wallbacteria bacterium HGW-Wallbacteria-1]